MARGYLTLLSALTLVLGTGLGLLGWLLWPGGAATVQIARGTVVTPATCGLPDAQDTVRVDLLDGRAVQARLDGCGNRAGDVLTVEVPDPLPSGEPVVQLAGTGVAPAVALVQRVSAVLLVLAGIAGALLAWRLRNVRR